MLNLNRLVNNHKILNILNYFLFLKKIICKLEILILICWWYFLFDYQKVFNVFDPYFIVLQDLSRFHFLSIDFTFAFLMCANQFFLFWPSKWRLKYSEFFGICSLWKMKTWICSLDIWIFHKSQKKGNKKNINIQFLKNIQFLFKTVLPKTHTFRNLKKMFFR